MRSFLLNKLVRDKVFTNMQELGQQVTHHRLSDKEIMSALQKKLLEEAQEFDPTKPNACNELADLLEVIESAGLQMGQDFTMLRGRQLALREKRGSFTDRTYVERLDLEDDDPWVAYYTADPDRFPEV